MPSAVTIKPRIVEGLRREALALSSEVAVTFAPLPAPTAPAGKDERRSVMAQEGLRAATTLIAALTWLDAYQAFFRREIGRAELSHRTRLPAAAAPSPQSHRLDPAARRLCEATRQFHERLSRLDETWRLTAPCTSAASEALQRLRERMKRAPSDPRAPSNSTGDTRDPISPA